MLRNPFRVEIRLVTYEVGYIPNGSYIIWSHHPRRKGKANAQSSMG